MVVISAADTDAGAAQARALAGTARALVLCGNDAPRLGALAAALRDRVQVALYCGDPSTPDAAAALSELVQELFTGALDGEPPDAPPPKST